MEIIKANKGFVLVTLMALLPLLIAAAMAFTFSSQVLLKWHQTHKICRSESMGLQSQLGQLLRSLMLLNPLATKLRFDEIQTTVKLAAAVAQANPPAVALLTAKLKMIHAKQKNLDRQQKLILSTAKVRILKWQTSLNFKLRPHTKGVLQLENPTHEALAVEPWPKGATAPTYKIKDNFAQEQMVGAKWSKPIRGECFATLKQRKLSWIPALSEAKFYLK